jgi:hypothetical protein
VIVASLGGHIFYESSLTDLLPHGFGPVDLNK